MKKDHNVIAIAQLKPTQITVGMRLVEHKCRQLQGLQKRPSELVEFILQHPIRVVIGPNDAAYVIDHHHLALALKLQKFETAPMRIEHNFATLAPASFWKKMQSDGMAHPYDAQGKLKSLRSIPKKLKDLKDDPYRSLAGFVREEGGFAKVQTPYAEFTWADFYRTRVKEKLLHKHFNKAFQLAMDMAQDSAANGLPGYVKAPIKRAKKKPTSLSTDRLFVIPEDPI